MTHDAPANIALADPALLDADTRRILARLEADPFLDPTTSVEQMRAGFERFYAELGAGHVRQAAATDRDIPGRHGPIPIRVYTPRAAALSPRPILVFFHGGGSMMGGLESYDVLCDSLCGGSGALLVSVAYRLAPEHAFSVAVDDCYDALLWCHTNAAALGGDPARLAVGGESGGGGLAAIVTQIARQEAGPPLAFQLLIYPFVGTRGASRSMAEFAKGFFFDAETLAWFIDLNFPDRAVLRDWRVAPVWADDFADLPPALVVTAGADILRDDAEDYARRLANAGVPTELERFEGTIHGFLMMAPDIEAGRRAIDLCGQRLRAALGS